MTAYTYNPAIFKWHYKDGNLLPHATHVKGQKCQNYINIYSWGLLCVLWCWPCVQGHVLFLCRCYILPSKSLSHDSNTSDLVINTEIKEEKLLSFLLQCTGHPFSLFLWMSSSIRPSCVSIYCEITRCPFNSKDIQYYKTWIIAKQNLFQNHSRFTLVIVWGESGLGHRLLQGILKAHSFRVLWLLCCP